MAITYSSQSQAAKQEADALQQQASDAQVAVVQQMSRQQARQQEVARLQLQMEALGQRALVLHKVGDCVLACINWISPCCKAC